MWSMRKDTQLHCKTVYVSGTDVLQSFYRHTRRKKGNRKSNGHRFFNLTPYRFLLSPPRWCPSHSAVTDLTDREELCLSCIIRRKKLVRDEKSVSAYVSVFNLFDWLVKLKPSQHIRFSGFHNNYTTQHQNVKCYTT